MRRANSMSMYRMVAVFVMFTIIWCLYMDVPDNTNN